MESPTISWSILPPASGRYASLPPIGPKTTREQLIELRARILFDGGRRPSFRREDGVYVDEDALDSSAFHVAIRAQGELIGCIRTNPIAGRPRSTIALLLERPLLERVLGSLGADASACWEAGRWAVAPA
jgi:hypothetical protein